VICTMSGSWFARVRTVSYGTQFSASIDVHPETALFEMELRNTRRVLK
jgi:hypothetical protein